MAFPDKKDCFLYERNVELSVYNAKVFEWTTVLPLSSHKLKGPNLNIQDSDINMVITVDSRKRYTVLLCIKRFKRHLSFNYKFRIERKNEDKSERDILFKSRGRCDLNKIHTSFLVLKFDENQVRIPGRHRLFPAVFVLCVEDSLITDCTYPATDDKCIQTSSYMNENLHAHCLANDFQKLLDTGLNSDAEARCGDKVIKVHSCVLSARSEVLKAVFASGQFVHFQGMGETDLLEFLRYIYTDRLPELTFEKAKRFYETAEFYAMRNLKEKCKSFLIENLTEVNACESLAFGYIQSDDDLIKAATNYILNAHLYLNDRVWLPFCHALPNVALEILNKSHKMSLKKQKICL